MLLMIIPMALKFGRKTRIHEVEASLDSLAILLPLNTAAGLQKSSSIWVKVVCTEIGHTCGKGTFFPSHSNCDLWNQTKKLEKVEWLRFHPALLAGNFTGEQAGKGSVWFSSLPASWEPPKPWTGISLSVTRFGLHTKCLS